MSGAEEIVPLALLAQGVTSHSSRDELAWLTNLNTHNMRSNSITPRNAGPLKFALRRSAVQHSCAAGSVSNNLLPLSRRRRSRVRPARGITVSYGILKGGRLYTEKGSLQD